MPTVMLPVTYANCVINKKPGCVFRDKETFSIGANQRNTVYRTLLYIDLDILSDDIDIDSASLKMFAADDRNSGSNQNTLITPYIIMSPWNENEVTWENQPEINVQMAGSTAEVRTAGWINFDVTKIVKSWINGTFLNLGLLLKSSGDILSDLKKFFSLKTHTSEQYCPVLEIKYKFKNPVSICSRNAVSFFEQYRTDDIFLYSKWIDISTYTKCTFFVQNTGEDIAVVRVQISPDKRAVVTENQEIRIAPKETKVIEPMQFSFYTRLTFKSLSSAHKTVLKIWTQAQV